MELRIEEICRRVLLRFRDAGFQAYLAGSCVRTLLLNGTPPRYRILTDAPVSAAAKLFQRYMIKNRALAAAVENKTAFEILFLDCGEDSFSERLKQELGRYHFTIDAMGYSLEAGVVDFYGGIEDFQNKIIQCTYLPRTCFKEDAVKMVRAIRLSAVLGFRLDETVGSEIKRCAVLIKQADKARIFDECNKILMSSHPGTIQNLRTYGLMQYVMPALNVCFDTPQRNKYHIYNVGEHIMHAVENTRCDFVLRWAALLHDIGKPGCMSVDAGGVIHFYGHHKESVQLAEALLRGFKIEQEPMKEILTLVEYHDVRMDTSVHAVKRMMARLGENLFAKLMDLQEADNRAKNPKYLDEKLKRINAVREIYQNIISEGQPYRLSDLAVGSRDLVKLKYKAGREIGETLRKLLDEVLVDPALNNRDYLLRRARELKKSR